MNKNTANEIITILKEEIKNPKCELNFKNNYELLISVVLSAQTTDKRVNNITPLLFSKYNDFVSLSNANINDVIEIIKPLGLAYSKANNIIKLSKEIVNNYNSIVPNSFEELTKLSGVGRKTAQVVLIEGFNVPAIPVDTHLIRMAHVFGFSKSDDVKIIEDSYKKYIKKEDWILSHRLFLLFGRYTCKAKNPLCFECKLRNFCKIIKK